ncbi:hypothetical protein GCM10009736_62810 [Actinomadura bangladeshensis]
MLDGTYLQPKADANEIRRVAEGSARIAMSGPVTMVVGGKQATVGPGSLAPHLVGCPSTR